MAWLWQFMAWWFYTFYFAIGLFRESEIPQYQPLAWRITTSGVYDELHRCRNPSRSCRTQCSVLDGPGMCIKTEVLWASKRFQRVLVVGFAVWIQQAAIISYQISSPNWPFPASREPISGDYCIGRGMEWESDEKTLLPLARSCTSAAFGSAIAPKLSWSHELTAYHRCASMATLPGSWNSCGAVETLYRFMWVAWLECSERPKGSKI